MVERKWFTPIDIKSLHYNYYVYFDIPDSLVAPILLKHHLTSKEFKVMEIMKSEKTEYLMVKCRVKKTHDNALHKVLTELPTNMSMMGHTDYVDTCAAILTRLDEFMKLPK